MKSPPLALFTIRCLVWETFRQSMAARTFWLLLTVSGVCILFCLSVSVEGHAAYRPPDDNELVGANDEAFTGANPGDGRLSLAFGAVRLPLFRDAEAEVHFLLVLLARWVAGAGGTLLMLVWTAGFLPEFLQASSASVLLAKPVPRWSLLAGKYLGVLAFVGFQVSVFVVGTWAAVGLRTGIWVPSYLMTIPLLLLHFAVVYSFSAFLAVWTRSTVACIFGTIVFWCVCCAMNYGRHAVVALDPAGAAAGSHWVVEAGYWVLPKPADLMAVLDEALQVGSHFRVMPELEKVESKGMFHAGWSVLASVLFAVGLLGAASRQLATTDY
jgi:hypothetical protein